MSSPWHFTTLLDLVDHWQTLIAGVLAVVAAVGTIWATIKSANREIEASQAQTAVAQKQTETTIHLAQMRDENEFNAFRAMLEVAMTRVLAEAAWAKKTYPQLLTQAASTDNNASTVEALTVRQCITKGAFAELRSACVRQRSPLTREFLDLEGEIDNFALQCEDRLTNASVIIRVGKHAGLSEQLTVIEDKAFTLREMAARDGFGLTLPGRAECAGIWPLAGG
jgi:hypothetical protein